MACRGQEIALPADRFRPMQSTGRRRQGSYDSVLLLASADEDLETTFYLDQTAVTVSVQAGEGYIAQGDRRTWNRRMDKQPQYRYWARATGVLPGWIKRDRVGCYTTHMHSASGNDPYAFGYLFVYRLPLPAGARTLRAPDDPRVRFYAAAVARGVRTLEPAALLY
jgi:alpha-mannosidase